MFLFLCTEKQRVNQTRLNPEDKVGASKKDSSKFHCTSDSCHSPFCFGWWNWQAESQAVGWCVKTGLYKSVKYLHPTTRGMISMISYKPLKLMLKFLKMDLNGTFTNSCNFNMILTSPNPSGPFLSSAKLMLKSVRRSCKTARWHGKAAAKACHRWRLSVFTINWDGVRRPASESLASEPRAWNIIFSGNRKKWGKFKDLTRRNCGVLGIWRNNTCHCP